MTYGYPGYYPGGSGSPPVAPVARVAAGVP
jgi:hypothetical protein